MNPRRIKRRRTPVSYRQNLELELGGHMPDLNYLYDRYVHYVPMTKGFSDRVEDIALLNVGTKLIDSIGTFTNYAPEHLKQVKGKWEFIRSGYSDYGFIFSGTAIVIGGITLGVGTVGWYLYNQMIKYKSDKERENIEGNIKSAYLNNEIDESKYNALMNEFRNPSFETLLRMYWKWFAIGGGVFILLLLLTRRR